MNDSTGNLRVHLENAAAALARFVGDEPLLASLAAVVLVALVLYVLAKVARTALVFALVLAMIAGLIVYTLGPDRARSYLDELQRGPAAAEH